MLLSEAKALATLTEHLLTPPWDSSALLEAAQMAPLVSTAPPNRELTDADAALNIAYWRVLALLSPFAVPQNFANYYQMIREALIGMGLQDDEARDPAITLARFLLAEARSHAASGERAPLSLTTREDLWELSSGRCWYCGYAFSTPAAAAFLQKEALGVALPTFVDFVTRQGTEQSHLRVEVDHVAPLSRSNDNSFENLRLACGWCNRHKGARSLLFDASAVPRVVHHPALGRVYVPQPFWVVRRLGTRRRCDSHGCTARTENTHLRVAPATPLGALVPGNLGVYCADHDPLAQHRLVRRGQ